MKRKEFNLNALRYEKESFLRKSGLENSFKKGGGRRRKNSNNSNNVEIPVHKVEEQKLLLYEYIKFFDKLFNLINKKMGSEDHDKFDIELLSTIILQLFDKSHIFANALVNVIDGCNRQSIGLFNDSPTMNQAEFEPVYPESWANFILIESDQEKIERLQRWISLVKNSNLFEKMIDNNIYIINKFIQKLLLYYNDNYVIKQKCRWQCLYCYNVFITFVYEQVRSKANIKEIDEILMNLLNAILINNYYMNLFHSLLITKTDLNDFEQIDILLEFLANSLERMKLNKSRSLLNFEFSLIIKVVNHTLGDDNFISIEKCLLFLYKYSKIIGDRFMSEVWDKCLFTSKFFDLFLHWSPAVRKILYYLIIFNYYDNSACKQRIDKVIALVEYEKNIYERNLKDKTLPPRKKLLKRLKKNSSAKPEVRSSERINSKYRIYTPNALQQFKEVEHVYRTWNKEYHDDFGRNKLESRKESFPLPGIDVKILRDGLENSMIKKLI